MISPQRFLPLSYTFLSLILLGMAPLAVAASGDALTPLRMTEANAGIKVDGVLNEPVWQQLASLGDMRVTQG